MRHASSKALFEYWNVLRAGRPAPERSEVEPADVRQILGDTFILEVSHELRTIAYRLAGTRLCAAHGRELKGLGFLALWREEDNFDIARAVHRVYQEFTPVVLSYRSNTADDRTLDYEGLLLPLMPAAGGNARILGISTPKSHPYWLGSEPLVQNALKNIRNVDLPADAPSVMTELAEASTENNGAFGGKRRVHHLTVLDGGLS